MRWVLAFVSFAALAPSLAGQDAPDWSRPRALPSLDVRWRVAVDACDVLTTDDVVYVLAEDGLVAHDAVSGDVSWEQDEVGGSCLYSARQLVLVDAALFVGTPNGVYRLAASTGDVTEFLPMARVRDMFDPPLLVDMADEDEQHHLVRIDPLSGTEVARASLPGSAWSLAATSEFVLVVPSESRRFIVRALRMDDLSEVWRRSGYSRVHTIGDELYLESLDDEGYGSDLFHVDPATGQLGDKLPERRDDWWDSNRALDWEVQLLDDDGQHRARRNRIPSGEAVWTVNLPGFPRGVLRTEEVIYFHCGRRGRGILLELDWQTGELLSYAYSIRGARIRTLGGDALVLEGDEDVVVVSRTSLGPAENDLYPVDDEVLHILGTPIDAWSLDDPFNDLKTLGPDAFPALTRELPALSWLWIEIVAPVLADGDYQPAFEPLAKIVRERPVADAHARRGHEKATEAMARLGDRAAVPLLTEILADDALDYVHDVALTGLVDIGTPEATHAVARFIHGSRNDAYRFPRAEPGTVPRAGGTSVRRGRGGPGAPKRAVARADAFERWRQSHRGTPSRRKLARHLPRSLHSRWPQ